MAADIGHMVRILVIKKAILDPKQPILHLWACGPIALFNVGSV